MRPSLRSCRWQSSARVARAPTRFRAKPRRTALEQARSHADVARGGGDGRGCPTDGDPEDRAAQGSMDGRHDHRRVARRGCRRRRLSFRHIRPGRRAAVHRGSRGLRGMAFEGRARVGAGPCIPRHARVHSVVAGGPGYVASGWTEGRALVWTSADGRHWEEIEDRSLGDRSDQSTPRHRQRHRWASAGHRRRYRSIWTSANGVDWLAATNDYVALRSRGACTLSPRMTGAPSRSSRDGLDGPASVWETTGRAEWERVGRLPEKSASVGAIAGGNRGWVAIGSTSRLPNAAWTSEDG